MRSWAWIPFLILLVGGDEAAAFGPVGALAAQKQLLPADTMRQTRAVSWGPPLERRQGWHDFQARYGGASSLGSVSNGWRATWDEATRVPSRIFGQGVPALGSLGSAAVAERFGRAFLAENLELLAPGAKPSDFVLVANDLDQGMRTLGFAQYHRGLRVVGAQLSFRFKHDRLFVIASEAAPHVDAVIPTSTIEAASAFTLAGDWIAEDARVATPTGARGPLILPVVAEHGVLAHRVVLEVVVEAREPYGRWSVYLDAVTGERVWRKQTLLFASGSVLLDVPERRPSSTRIDAPAALLSASVSGTPGQLDGQGIASWPGSGPADLTVGLTSSRVVVQNRAGTDASVTFALADGASFVWSDPGTEFVDAQLATYVAASRVKERAKMIAPSMTWLFNVALVANVNVDDVCNAFSDGETINFFRAGRGCENTGRLADVVMHEFGHAFHAHAIIEGVGAFDGALSEGASDYLAATMTGDPGVGRGITGDTEPIRDLDGATDARWPDDVGEIHKTGVIFGGAMWDVRKAMIDKLGDAGIAYTDNLWYQALRRAVDIPSTYIEVLAADDNDGNLENGTPNLCLIEEAFGRHGLVDRSSAGLAIQTPSVDGFHVELPVAAPAFQCPGQAISSVELKWQRRGDDASDASGSLPLAAVSGGYAGDLPAQSDGTLLEYQVRVTLANGQALLFPRNAAAPWYELYLGQVLPLYCTDFESDPTKDGWTHKLVGGEATQGADDWQWGSLVRTAGSGDPDQAYSGTAVMGNDLGGGNFNGRYQADKVTRLTSPEIDTKGYPVVRLQYQRWLDVEDAFCDKATILASGTKVWGNRATGANCEVSHRDAEWRFHDVDVSDQVSDGKVQIVFELESDPGREFGGWTIDDFCVNAVVTRSTACGDGTVSGDEQCDDGNTDDGDGCASDCTLPAAECGDGVVGGAEQCDDGNGNNADECKNDCTFGSVTAKDGELGAVRGGCGCSGTGPGSAGWLVALLVALAPKRRPPARSEVCAC